MTAAPVLHADDFPTGPLPAVDRPRQPRDSAGRFAELPRLPEPPAPPVRREANGAVLICDDERVNRHRVRVGRINGRIVITYLDEETQR